MNLSSIFISDQISSIFLYQNQYIYLTNRTKNCIQLYHISGLPLNIFTKEATTPEVLQGDLIDNPAKVVVDKAGTIHLLNYHNNLIRFRQEGDLIPFSSNPFLDPDSLHLNPIDFDLIEDDRIAVLYIHPSRIGIYQYSGEKINMVDVAWINNDLGAKIFLPSPLPPVLDPFSPDATRTGGGEAIQYLNLYSKDSIRKYDKNGIPTNFCGDDYGSERLALRESDRRRINCFFYHQKIYLLKENGSIDCFNTGGYREAGIEDLPLGGSGRLIISSLSYPHLITLDEGGSLKVCDLEKKVLRNFDISYHLHSHYIPTTNMEVVSFLNRKKGIYKGLLQAYQLSTQYLQENKEYFFVYQDLMGGGAGGRGSGVKLPSYELIFICQRKYQMPLHLYLADPFLLKYPQHFPREKFGFYQARGELYRRIHQTFLEATFYQNVLRDVEKIAHYDDYLNKENPVYFHLSIPIGLFPRLPADQLAASYNKKQSSLIYRALF